MVSARWPSDPCRDESCAIEELHAAHAAIPLRGRTPKVCPKCLRSLADDAGHCAGVCLCGWARTGETVIGDPPPVVIEAPPACTPWVACPACNKAGCAWCSATGYVPRLRAVYLRKAIPMTEHSVLR